MRSRQQQMAASAVLAKVAACLALCAALFGPLLLPLHHFGPDGHGAPAAAYASVAIDAATPPGGGGGEPECRACTLLHATQSALAAPSAAAIVLVARSARPAPIPSAHAPESASLLLDPARAPPASI